MGGFSSGRKWGKVTTDEMLRLDIRTLVRRNCLQPGRLYRWQWRGVGVSIDFFVGIDCVWLTYRQRGQDGEWHDMSYLVQLDRTNCHLGGNRVWWLCPALGCGKRVAVLFGGKVFACRRCHRLAYRCQREVDYDRATRRADTLRDRLGWSAGMLNGSGDKPKGMHWSTFERLSEEHNDYVNRALTGVARRFGIMQSP